MRSISMRVLFFLSECQKDLKYMKISRGLAWHAEFVTRPIFTGLSALDIFVAEPRGMRLLVHTFLKPNPNLKKLSVAHAEEFDLVLPPDSLSLAMVEEAVTLPELQELTLFTFSVSDEQSHVRHELAPMSNLKRFTAFCSEVPFKNFARLDEHEPYDACNLQHLAIEVDRWCEPLFMTMLRTLKPLTSLHVRFRTDIILHSFIRALRTHGSSLRTFAMSFWTSHDNETDSVDQSDSDELCKICSNV
jgi:hypothetical protein